MEHKSKLSYKIFIIICLGCFWSAQAQETQGKSISNSFVVDETYSLVIGHRYGPVEIVESKDGQVSFEAEVEVSGKSQESVRTALSRFEVLSSLNGKEVNISVPNNIKNWMTNNQRTTITFKDGTKLKDLKQVKISMRVAIPTLQKVSIYNRYDKVTFADIHADVDIEVYDGKIEGGNVHGNLTLNSKYSDGNIAQVDGNLSAEIYDSDHGISRARNLSGDIKYSEISFEDLESLDIQLYDSELAIERISSASKINDKYSEIEIGTASQLNLELYDSEFTLERGSDMDLNSKYSEISLGTIPKLLLESYDDQIELSSVNEMEVITKYTEYQISRIEKSFQIESHDDNFSIETVGNNFNSSKFDGKYSEFEVEDMGANAYKIIGKFHYGSTELPNGSNSTLLKSDGSVKEIERNIGTNPTQTLELIGYDCQIQIE